MVGRHPSGGLCLGGNTSPVRGFTSGGDGRAAKAVLFHPSGALPFFVGEFDPDPDIPCPLDTGGPIDLDLPWPGPTGGGLSLK